MSRITLEAVAKSFGSVKVLHGIDLDIAQGELVVFVGPSGCGKSTLLRLIAGLDKPTSGTISIDGKAVNDVAAADRGLAMVFQSYALYPHMSVRQNLAFGLENAHMAKAEIDRRIAEAARMLDIEALLKRRPGQLSGGQRQRVAIGRAIVRKPHRLPARRAAVQPRRGAAHLHARRTRGAARAAGDDDDLRHPRPDRGDDAGRPHRRAAGWTHRAGRHAAGTLQPPGQPLRRRLHRCAVDEFSRRHARAERRRLARAASRRRDTRPRCGERRRRTWRTAAPSPSASARSTSPCPTRPATAAPASTPRCGWWRPLGAETIVHTQTPDGTRLAGGAAGAA